MLKITHNAGFYSCCTIRLEEILAYFNKFQQLPEIVDSSHQFAFYKTDYNQNLVDLFFKTENTPIQYVKDVKTTSSLDEQQFSNYSLINYSDLEPFVKKYFMPSDIILQHMNFLITQYSIDLENTCAVRFRGTDKCIETKLPSYEELVEKAKLIQCKKPNIKFLVQTDEKEFLEFFIKEFPDAIYFSELPTMNKGYTLPENLIKTLHGNDKIASIVLYVSAIQILAKCKYIITTSGNGEFWTMLYRGHNKNVLQFLHVRGSLLKETWLSTISF